MVTMAYDDTAHKAPLYEQLAAEIARQIDQGTFRPGERIPSVRQTSRQRNLSMTTVLQAYHLLEDRRMIEARPQSGYFVLSRPVAVMREPEGHALAPDPTTVDIADLVMMVLRDTANPRLVQFGCAIADANLLPTEKLNRLLASVARAQTTRDNPCSLPADGDQRTRAAQRASVPDCSLCSLPGGCEELRGQVARRAVVSGCSLSPGDIMITAGCTEAVHLALRSVSRPGDLIAVESPTYFGVLQILQSLGLQALEIPTHHRTGISLDALRFALDHHSVSAVLVMPNFQNPLGSTMPDENKRVLVEMLAEREIPLIEDDLFGELYFGGQRPRVCKSYDRDGGVILCSSFSKDLSPSYRIGWAAPGRFRARFERLKSATNLSTAILPQLAIARFIANGGYDHHLRRIRRAYAEKVAAMSQAVGRFFPIGTRITAPDGGFVLWVQLPETADALDLYRLALQSGITIAPGHIFSTTPRYRNFIRLNAAYMSDDNAVALRRLAELAERVSEGDKRTA
jgi:DNA-binding transcriptional MocR family regulator